MVPAGVNCASQLNNDLYSPSIGRAAVAEPVQPWRPASQFWVAIFCGPLVLTILAFLNSRKLGLPRSSQRFILVTGLLLTVLTTVIIIGSMYTFGPASGPNGIDVRARFLPRYSWQFLSLLWAAVLVRMQTPAARRYEAMSDAGYASMWKAGLWWSLVSAVVYGVPVFAAAWYFGFLEPVRP